MKRILVGLLAALLMTAGLSTVTSAPAQAACPRADGNYPGCIQTKVSSKGVKRVAKNKRATIFVGVKAAGNVAPRGTVRLRTFRAGRVVYNQTKTVRRASANVSRTSFKLPRLRVGRYTIRINYTPARQGLFVPSSGKTRTLTVFRPRR